MRVLTKNKFRFLTVILLLVETSESCKQSSKNFVYIIEDCNQLKVPGFKSWGQFTYIQANNNFIVSLDNGSFSGGSKIEIIDLRSNMIENIAEKALDGLENLQQLYLKNNSLRELKHGIFDPLVNLTALWLQDNQIIALEDDLFRFNKALTTLFLDNNKILMISPSVFGDLNLLEWNFGNNSCLSIPPQLNIEMSILKLILRESNCHEFYKSLKEFEVKLVKRNFSDNDGKPKGSESELSRNFSWKLTFIYCTMAMEGAAILILSSILIVRIVKTRKSRRNGAGPTPSALSVFTPGSN